MDHHYMVTNIDVWNGKLEENLLEAAKRKRLDEFLVSIAASVSTE